MSKLKLVLVGGFGVDLSLNFMYKQSATDLLILKRIKVRVCASVCDMCLSVH